MQLPLNHRLRYITADGRFDRTAIAAAAVARFQRISDPARYSRSIWSDEFASFTDADWRALALQETWAEARGEMALYEARKARVPTTITEAA